MVTKLAGASIPAAADSDLQSQGISLCWKDQYMQTVLIWQRETDRRGVGRWRREL